MRHVSAGIDKKLRAQICEAGADGLEEPVRCYVSAGRGTKAPARRAAIDPADVPPRPLATFWPLVEQHPSPQFGSLLRPATPTYGYIIVFESTNNKQL